MSPAQEQGRAADFLSGGGEMGRLMRAHDWSQTPLGTPASWPQPLKTLVEVMLAANQPMFVAWGPERTLLYNNPYIEVLADKHPALGSDFLEVWAEVRRDLAPLVEQAYRGEPSHSDDIELRMLRKGYLEEAHFAYSYTPVRDEAGAVAGFFCPFLETTEKVLADRRLKAERADQRRMLEQMPGFVAMLSGPEHRFEYANEAYREISGERELLGRTVREAFPDIADQGFFELLDRVYATGERFEAQALPIWLENAPDPRFIDLLYEPIRDQNGAAAGVFVGGYDVTERARAEQTLRASDLRFRSVLDGMIEGFGLLDADFKLLDLNEEAMRMESRPRDEIVGKTHWEAYPGSEDSEIGRLYKRAMAERTPIALEHRYAWEDGRAAWLETRAYPTSDGGLAVFYRDVTDRKRSETSLRETEERLRLAVDNAEMGFWDVDLVNDTLIWPTRTKALFGISADVPVTLQDFYEGLHPDDREATTEAFAAAADPARRALYDVDYRTIGKEDGVVRWVAAKGRGVFDEAGRCLRVTGTAIDITARKASEARLRDSEARHRFRVELGDALRRLDSPTEIMAAVAERLGPYLGVDQANYYIVEGDRFVVSEEWRSDRSPGLIGSHRIADFGPEARRRMDLKEMLRIEDTRGVDGAEGYAAAGMAAVLSAPLHSGGRWGGGFHVHSTEARAWTDEEAALVRETAERAWAEMEQTRAEVELRESEARFRLMADAVPQIVWITDRQGRMEFLNKQFADYTGARPEDWTPAEMAANFMHSEDGAAVVQSFAAALASGESFEIEHRIRSAAGEDRWFLARAEPYRDAKTGEIVRWFGASVDIHDRKLAEARLRELNETLEAQVAERTADRDRLWRGSQDLLMVARFDTTIVTINPAWEETLGWSDDEMVGESFMTFIHPDDLSAARGQAAGLSASPATAKFEVRYRAKSGDWISLAWSVSSSAGHFHGIARDVTAERDRQAELAIAQEALRQSQKMEAMGQLTGGVAHDFNNLLTPIIGSLDMLVRKGVGSERERRLIDGALQSAERAKTLVQRLLAFARRQPLQPVAVEVDRMVAGMAELIKSTLGPTIDVRTDLAADLPPAKADANQLEMALLNLAVNARDAMPNGGELTISALRESVRGPHRSGVNPGHYVRLCVADTGLGMDQATLARAVEPFFSTKGIGKGTGLGLSMVHGLAAQLGGGLTIESEPDRGTRISLWLPLSPIAAGADEVPAPTPAAMAGRGTALLVDDEELVRMSTADMLVDLGFEVVEAGSAGEALQLITGGMAPDLLVTDHLMPGMNGADLAREARLLRPTLPVLVVSGYAEVDGIAPEWPRLTKPFRNAELATMVAALIPAAH